MSQFEDSLADVQDRLDAFDSMSEEVAAHFQGMRESLMVEQRSLLASRRDQIQSELAVITRQLELMSEIPELQDAAARSELEHQRGALTAELGSLPGAPP